MKRTLVILCLILLVSCAKEKPIIGAGLGETVTVNYIGKFEDGTVFDTSIEAIGKEHNLEKTNYQPLTITLGKGQVISGFENALIAMNTGDKKTVTIQPNEGYGTIDASKIVKINKQSETDRSLTLNREVNVDLTKLPEEVRDTDVGEIMVLGANSYEILERTEDSMKVLVLVEEGDEIRLPNIPWNSTVTDVDKTEYTVRQDPENGSVMSTAFGPVRILVSDDKLTMVSLLEEGGFLQTQQGAGKVTKVGEEQVTLDFNHPLAGKILIFEIEVVG